MEICFPPFFFPLAFKNKNNSTRYQQQKMDKLRSHAKVKIHVENENLIMYGNPTESAGCVLRGIMNLQLQETSKIKSIGLELTGKMTISWTEGK